MVHFILGAMLYMGAPFVYRRGRRLIWRADNRTYYISPHWRILFDPYKQGGDKNRGAGIIRDTDRRAGPVQPSTVLTVNRVLLVPVNMRRSRTPVAYRWDRQSKLRVEIGAVYNSSLNYSPATNQNIAKAEGLPF